MNKQTLMAGLFMLVLGAGGGYWWANWEDTVKTPIKSPASNTAARKPLFYRSSMNPLVTSPVPAKDAMGMDYIPVYAEAGGTKAMGPPGIVSIDPVTVQAIGVRTASAKRTVLSRIIRAVGRVGFDEERIARLHPKTEGWIELLRVDKTGQWVKQGTDLLSIYSPQLVSSQQEYLLALNNLKALENSPFEDIRRGAEDLAKTSRERLKLLDVPEHQIRELEQNRSIKKGLHIHTPVSGIVMKIGAREGQYVTPATELYMIADLAKIWVYADIYEYELPWVRERDPAEIQLAGIPGKIFRGKVQYIYPYAEAKTRTIKVRLAFDNPEMLLKPEMFAEVVIHAGRKIDALAIPSEAVVRSGERDQVFVVRGHGKYEPRVVKLGLESQGEVQILDGVKAGEKVVISAQFLIDSESKLREAMLKMMEPAISTDTQAPDNKQPRRGINDTGVNAGAGHD